MGTYVLPWMVSHHFLMRVRVTRCLQVPTGLTGGVSDLRPAMPSPGGRLRVGANRRSAIGLGVGIQGTMPLVSLLNLFI